ncbi:MAG: SpoIID/LytB domain-containing protein [Ignavibacteriaceae bacterium]|nr:SpoIID/LytB domain-containing protein [Ignavibacteriaceae bacterium]
MISISKEPNISVGILSEKKIDFELHGDFKLAGTKQVFSGKFTAEIENNKVVCRWNNDKLEIPGDIIFVPQDIQIESFLLRNVKIGVNFHWERKEKEIFAGSLKLIKENDNVTAINVLPIERYLLSVISSEMSAKSSLQLLKAHAIISRSWLLAQTEKAKINKKDKIKYEPIQDSEDEYIRWYGREDHELYDVCADDHCQRYQGISKIFTEVARQAVKQTSGVVLISDNKICDARYSKSCGGITESFENVWEPVKYNYLSSVIDYKFEPENYNLNFSVEANARKWIKGNPQAFCNTKDRKILSHVLVDYDQETNDFYRWKVEFSQKEISAIIRTKTGIDFGDILDLIPIERGKSSRIIKLKIVGSNKTLIIGKELEIRRSLSPSHLYSSAFVVEKEDIQDDIPQKFILTGAGWGHGVGLCQIGAAFMATKGYQFDEILVHYFKKARLKKIY